MLARGYKATSLSVASGFSRFILERWMAGEGMPTDTSIVRLARVLRVRPASLTGQETTSDK